ncbi:MAG TPA: PAS domain-containing sensor histidine kinase [Terriglobales bacterium]|nr:PAS domain-containing sensor histidine kinase [Terriglobales bacterium]
MTDIEPVEDLEDLYENAPCGYLSLRPDGKIAKSNATLSAWIGFTQEQLAGKRFLDLLNIAGRIFYETHFAPLLRMQGFFNEVALDLVTASGARFAVLANALVRRDPEGRLLFIRVTLFNAAERRQYERALVAAKDAAQRTLNEEREMSQLREQFIAVLGHDLRNPLTSILGVAEMLLRKPQTEQSKTYLELLVGSAHRMSSLIDNVLDFARGRLGSGIGLNLESDVHLAGMLVQVVEELRAGTDREIDADISIIHPVQCDPVRLGQLTSNLLGNALTHGAADTPVRLHALTHDGLLEITVANSGKPIPAAALDQLFQPFFRGEVRRSQQGLGLGLYISSEIAKAHGGTLTVQSSERETSFTFRMPVVRSTAVEQSPRPDND